jgi:peptidoglycan/xylan/chitin deacetylase (PgdA/CDA1 family)
MSRVLLIFFLVFLVMGFTASSAGKKPIVVVLSFDYEDLNLPTGGENLPGILSVLERRNISSTFFILGAPENVQKIYEGGHSLGLHTYYHNFPILSREDAALIGEIYDRSVEVEWNRSFKTPEAFQADLGGNRKAIQHALGFDVRIEMFRAPSLVVNWVNSEAYYDVLLEGGIKLDSSTYQDFKNPRAYHVEKGIVVVPIVTFESRLDNHRKSLALAEKSARAKVPFHLALHPQNLGPQELAELEEFLNILEVRYEVTYLPLEDVQSYYSAM